MTIISLAIIILVILDICMIREMDKMEDHLQVTLRVTGLLCDAFKKHIQEEEHNDKRSSD